MKYCNQEIYVSVKKKKPNWGRGQLSNFGNGSLTGSVVARHLWDHMLHSGIVMSPPAWFAAVMSDVFPSPCCFCHPVYIYLSLKSFEWLFFSDFRGQRSAPTCTYPEIIAACCQDRFVGVKFLLTSDERHVAQQAVLPLLVEGRENRVLVGLWMAKPLSCQHLLTAADTHTYIQNRCCQTRFHWIYYIRQSCHISDSQKNAPNATPNPFLSLLKKKQQHFSP